MWNVKFFICIIPCLRNFLIYLSAVSDLMFNLKLLKTEVYIPNTHGGDLCLHFLFLIVHTYKHRHSETHRGPCSCLFHIWYDSLMLESSFWQCLIVEERLLVKGGTLEELRVTRLRPCFVLIFNIFYRAKRWWRWLKKS